MNITEQQMLDFISGRDLPTDVRKFIAEHRRLEGHPINLWIADFVGAAADPCDVDWDFLATDASGSDNEVALAEAAVALRRTARFPHLFERLQSILAFPAKQIIGAASAAMVDNCYFSTAAQIQQLLCGLGFAYGVEAIRLRLTLASYLQLADKAVEAESVLYSLVDSNTLLLDPTVLVGMTDTQIDELQLQTSDAFTQHFADRRDIDQARFAIEQTEIQRKNRELPPENLCNYLNAQAALDVFSDNLESAAAHFRAAKEFGHRNLGDDNIFTAITTLNLSTVDRRMGIASDKLRGDAIRILKAAYPSIEFSNSLRRLPVRANGCRGIAIVC